MINIRKDFVKIKYFNYFSTRTENKPYHRNLLEKLLEKIISKKIEGTVDRQQLIY